MPQHDAVENTIRSDQVRGCSEWSIRLRIAVRCLCAMGGDMNLGSGSTTWDAASGRWHGPGSLSARWRSGRPPTAAVPAGVEVVRARRGGQAVTCQRQHPGAVAIALEAPTDDLLTGHGTMGHSCWKQGRGVRSVEDFAHQ